MDLSVQFSGGEDDSDRLTEEEYFGMSCSSGDDDDDSFGNDSEMGDEVHRDGVGAALMTKSAEDFVGKVFSTEEEAYAAYKQLARLRGFGVRKGDVARINGLLVRQDIFCHRQGTRHEKHYDRPKRVREERLESRTGCLAKLKIYYDTQDQLWKVRRIEDSHNHPLATTMFSHLLRSHWTLSESDKAQVDSLKKFGIATLKIMAYMAGQLGGYGILRFTKRDLNNYVHSQRIAQINNGDAVATIKPEFRKVFKKAVYANFDVAEFEEYWKTAVESLRLMNNNWSWATTYLQGTFCAEYRTTSRYECINAFIKGFLQSTNILLELVLNLDRVVKDYRNNEVTAQFYSQTVFKVVRKQIKGVGSLLFLGKDSISTTSIYKLSSMGNCYRVCKVLYDLTEPKIECDC
ncbi:hypothetical protein Ahy_B03g063421 [Arachis hypogaea]|uniref:FAR1 domain-containing protein n=1 Tax=Arachis hypogaea TaxID=3818 RepID=A0A444ZX99_ARAHY|nr:hypothetical protein Ahy_B03g063421 [Arachis hypogaea]